MTLVSRLPALLVMMLLVLLLPRPAAAATITFTSAAPASPVTAGTAMSHTFTATGDTAVYFSLPSGALPAGVSLTSAGVLSGTPSTVGTFTFTVRATGSPSGDFAEQPVTIVVQAPTVTFTSPAPPSPLTAWQPFTHTFTATGGAAPHHFFLVSGALPAGVSFTSGGILSGSPTTTGSFTFVLKAADNHGFESAPYVVSVTVAEPATVFTASDAPDGTAGTPYSFAFTATGDSDIQFSVTAGAVPTGLTLAPNGVLSGTPSAAGSYTFTVKATGTATTATQEVTVVIANAGGPTLPLTGVDVMLIVAVAAGVLVVGGLLVFLARRRRQNP